MAIKKKTRKKKKKKGKKKKSMVTVIMRGNDKGNEFAMADDDYQQ